LRDRQIGDRLGDILLETNQVSRRDIETALQEQHQNRGQRLGEMLEKNRAITREDLAVALKRQESMPVMRLGEALLQMKYISQEQLDTALEQQRNDRKTPLGQILVNAGIIDERRLKEALAEKLGIPFVDLDSFAMEFDVSSKLNEDIARKHGAIPLYVEHGVLVVALNDPLNSAAIDSLRFHSQLRIAAVMASREAISKAIERCYGASVSAESWGVAAKDEPPSKLVSFTSNAEEKSKTEELVTQLNLSTIQHIEVNEPRVTESDNNLVKLVNKILTDANLQRATDIHIENYPDKQDTCIRFRRDGALYDYLNIPCRFRSAIVSRIKIMASLDISEKRKPQDGKLEFCMPGEPKLEFRVATIPTANGLEDIVLRLLAGATLRSLEHIGMDDYLTQELKQLIAKPYGMILVCGPTGSGKTTTLHSLLSEINTRERKIWTAEDPVEITHPGLRQVQVNSKIGWTFAATLRAFLRGDPDVIMVGEMRDLETSHIAMEASLTGHLVLSTLHTNSAVDSVVRLLDMGLDPYNFADALLGVIAQRLARKVCVACGVKEPATDEELDALAQEYCVGSALSAQSVLERWKQLHDGSIMLHRPQGCNECGQTGYRGRVGIYELFSVNRKSRSLMQRRSAMEELLDTAKADGMITLKQNGIEKIMAGHTDLKQVRAVCG
jgi:type II secretory ATPase GspE/PulE/Tfp pilus assembly ATPase PilB-like protein